MLRNSLRMKRRSPFATLILLMLCCGLLGMFSSVSAQDGFGKNKVQYRTFDWKYIQTRHFDIYFYGDAYGNAKFCADVLEAAYDEITAELNYKIQRRIPLFLYNSHNDFQQTNITGGILPEGVGGFTEAFKNRMALPHNGSLEDLRHVLHHELTHAIINDLVFGGAIKNVISSQRLFDLPLWFAEGYAEYSSRHGWDYFADMIVRDATINNYLAPPDYIGGYLAYKQGQAMVKYIVDRWGEEKLGELIRKGKIHLSMSKAIKAALDIEEKKFWEDFQLEMKRRYWPEIAERKAARELGTAITKSYEDGSAFNERPVFLPSGNQIAYYTDKSDYTEIVLASAEDGRKVATLATSERSGDLESLHSFVSGFAISPDGKQLVFAAKSKGQESLIFVDIKKRKIIHRERLEYHNVVFPSWSPDGKTIAFSALNGPKRDLFLYDVASSKVTQLTNDRFDDVEATWAADGSAIYFSSDRPHPESPAIDHLGHPVVKNQEALLPGDIEYGDYNIFGVNPQTTKVEPLLLGPGSNRRPTMSRDGRKLAFLSNRNGIDNIYVHTFSDSQTYAVTDILTGVQDLSWSPDGEKIAFSAFNRAGFDIYVMKEVVPTGNKGVLSLTGFMTGKYNEPIQHPGKDRRLLADSLRLKRDSAMIANAAQAAPADSTGLYDDEYVYVSTEEEDDALDTLLTSLPNDDPYGASTARAEPPSFDSIPGRLPSGEYDVFDYETKYSIDYFGGGFGYDTFFGLSGLSYLVWSDYLGDNQFFIAADLVNSLDQALFQAAYFSNKHRTNLGVGIFHSKNFYVDSDNFLFSDRYYGFQLFANRPSSIFRRLEGIVSQTFIDRNYVDFDDPRPDRSTAVTTGEIAYVFDNVRWGATAPNNGVRSRLSLEAGISPFSDEKIDYYSAEFDYRSYENLRGGFSTGFRLAGGISEGSTPKQYFLGGTSGWIGSRDYDASVYEVENLYFADVITPLRGEEFYGLSGDRFALMNFEFRFPLIQYLVVKFPLPIVLANIQGTLFTDIGAAWSGNNFRLTTTENGNRRLRDLKSGFGVGVRTNLFGLALLRYDLAWSTDMYSISKEPTSYFSLGADF